MRAISRPSARRNRTAVPSLVLGIEPNELRLEDGVSMIYGSCISWDSDTKPATKEIYPARAFDRLVSDGADRELDRSILDVVLDQAQDLRPRVSQDDRRKLDEYLESVRDIETRIERASREERLEGWRPSITEPNMPRPAENLPQDVPDHMKLMLDVIVLVAGIGGGYALAISSHLLFEGNRPMIAVNPVWGALADMRMTWLAATGRLPAELHRHRIEEAGEGAASR